MTSDQLAKEVTVAAARELNAALERIEHCLDQLTDEQVWLRPGAGQNSIANLLLHVAGNLRQWIVVGLGGGEDQRDRPQEFADDSGVSKAQLIALLDSAVRDAQAVLAAQTTAELTRVRHIQEWDVNGLTAIFDSIPHFRGHTQEIVFRTRLLLGELYRFAWTPQ
jgi:uncharacterized damage-inducible protein DinB